MSGRQTAQSPPVVRAAFRSLWEPAMELTQVAERFQRATEEIGKVLVGQHELVEATLIALFSEGNVLIEGVPGLGKTLLVNTLSKALPCRFTPLPFTPHPIPSPFSAPSSHIPP